LTAAGSHAALCVLQRSYAVCVRDCVFDGDGCQQTVGIQLGKEAQQTCVLERNVFRDTNVDVQQLATL
jgi:hypothetical protein